MPKFPDRCEILTLDESVNAILTSIAMEETALSHIINAEGEKIQFVLGTLEGPRSPVVVQTSLEDLLRVNESVRETLDAVSMNQMFLLGKLSAAVNGFAKLKECEKSNQDGGNNYVNA